MSDALSVGRDVDAWCTRCRMDLSHVIVAMVGRDVAKVQCNTCGSLHKYYPPKKSPAPRSTTRRTVVKKSKEGQQVVVESLRTKTPRAAEGSNPPRAATEASARAARKTPSRRVEAPKAPASLERWNEEVRPLDNPDVRRYSPRETFDPGELLRHSKFGVGKVLGRRDATKIVVLFREGEKLLVTGLI